MKVGFDLDRVFISSPPLIPGSLIDWLYRGHQTNGPSYRFPSSKVEQFIRKISHFFLFRPAIKQNVNFLKQISNSHSDTYFLISSRYKFLESLTYKLLKKYNLYSLFSEIYLNLRNEQPHLFKEQVLKKLKIDLYIDDDLKLLKYLQKSCPGTKLFWYDPSSNRPKVNGITTIKNLIELKNYLK